MSGKRIVINSLVGYLRIFLSAIIALISIPVLIDSLGIEQFGLYTVVAGFVSMLSFVRGALAIGAQRHISYETGRGESGDVARVFVHSLIVQVGFTLFLVLLLEVFGVYFVFNVLKVGSSGDSWTAFWVLQGAIGAVILNFIFVPYLALLVARENMFFVSVLELWNSIGLLLSAFSVKYISSDRVVWYSFFTALITLTGLLMAVVYCTRKYTEARCTGRFVPSKSLIIELLTFGFWNLIGSLAGVGRTQGTALVLNGYFGPVINASYGVAMRVSNFHNSVTFAIRRAATAQIVENEGSGDSDRSLSISFQVSKFTFFMAIVWVVPVFVELDWILNKWIDNLPPGTLIFTRLVLISLTLDLLTVGFMSSLQAIGKIGKYQLVVGLIALSPVPVSAFFYSQGAPPYTVLIINVFATVLVGVGRVYFLNSLSELNVWSWMKTSLSRCLLAACPLLSFSLCVYFMIDDGLIRVFITFLGSLAFWVIGIYYMGLSKDEKAWTKRLLLKTGVVLS